MYHRGMKWEEYLEHQGFKDDIVRGLEKQTQSGMDGQARAAQQISDAQKQTGADTTAALDQGFGKLIASQEQMNAVMQQGFEAMTFGLGQIKGGIEALRVDFNWAMGAVLWKMEMQHATLRGILSTLQAPLDTAAKELRKRAEDAYLNGWYDEALGDFLQSEQKNYQDFAVHQAIGNIYLYRQQPANIEKAREYYLKAGKYATPRSAYHAAYGYMYAGFASYLLRDDAAAIAYSQRAMELYPNLIEAFYNHAKFSAVAARPELAIPALEIAIRADRNYAVKARADADFETISADLLTLMERLRKEARQKIEVEWLPLRRELERYVIPPSEQSEIKTMRTAIENLFVQDTYFGYLDGLPTIAPLREAFNSLRLPERDRLCEEANNLLSQAQVEMEDYVLTDAVREKFDLKVAEVKGLLREDLTFAQALAIRDRCKESSVWIQKLWWEELSNKPIVLAGVGSGSHIAFTFSPGGTMLVLAQSDTVWLWDVAGQRKLAVLKGHSELLHSIAFSPDGKILASSFDETVWLWDVAGQCELAVLKGHSGGVTSVAFSPDGKILASSSLNDKTVRLWNVAGQRELAMLKGHSDYVTSVAFSPDGKILASGSWDKTVRLWNVAGQRELAVLKGHSDYVTSVAFSPDGKILASGSFDHTVRLWDVAGQRELAVLKVHSGRVISVAFSPDGKILASGSDDKTVRLWDVAGQRKLAMLIVHSNGVTSVAFSPEGKMLATSSKTEVCLWELLIHKGDVVRIEQQHKEERLRIEEQQRIEEQEQQRIKEQQRIEEQQRIKEAEQQRLEAEKRLSYRNSGRCEICGVPLSVMEKLKGQHFCKNHRSGAG